MIITNLLGKLHKKLEQLEVHSDNKGSYLLC